MPAVVTSAILARAAADPLNANALLVLIGAATAAAAAVAAGVAGGLAARRRHRRRETVVALAVVWAGVTAAVVVWAVDRSWAASAEWDRSVAAGDANPRETPPDADFGWPAWAGLAVAYAGLLAWAAAGRGDGPPPPG